MKIPFLYAPDEPVAAPAVEPAPAAEPAVEPAPGPGPWMKDAEAYFPDLAAREAFDRYMREKQTPYVTSLEARASEAEGKNWVFDALNGDDPAGALREIAEQVYDADIASKVDALLRGGADPTEVAAAADATQAARTDDKPVIDLDALPPEVKAAVEYAKTAAEKDAAREAAEKAQEELEAGVKLYDEWRIPLLKAQPDIVEQDLHHYVAHADGDMEAGLAAYRAVHPAPATTKPEPTATLGGATSSGISPSRPSTGSVGQAFGDVFDAAFKSPAI
jgi:hypothetical protein